LITAGPTREHLDPIRYLSNGSSGKMGYALAASARARGWEVDLVSGPVSLPAPSGATLFSVVSAEEMLAACLPLFPLCDLFFAVAAVADYRPERRQAEKMKKTDESMTLRLVPTVDVLRTLASGKTERQTVVGFAAETSEVEAYARRKLQEKNCDWIVANDVSAPDVGMNAEENAVLLMSREGSRLTFGPLPKRAVADFILDQVTANRTLG
jgi:phosphopantothenoylcysteine decarboxylase/phosphopantothenate--cysteine ligase